MRTIPNLFRLLRCGTSMLPLTRVILLTLSTLLFGCSMIESRYAEQCNTRAYVVSDIPGYIKSRYQPFSPVRVAIIPFTTPANIAAYSNELPGMGNLLAQRVHAEFLRLQAFPITEVLNRQDWPGKKEEFFTGNFNALNYARDAGYDLALIGFVENITDMDSISVHTKLIETESGLTLWYGRTTITTNRPDFNAFKTWFYAADNMPNRPYSHELIEMGARCITEDMLKDYE